MHGSTHKAKLKMFSAVFLGMQVIHIHLLERQLTFLMCDTISRVSQAHFGEDPQSSVALLLQKE